jgi:hypothetical protein
LRLQGFLWAYTNYEKLDIVRVSCYWWHLNVTMCWREFFCWRFPTWVRWLYLCEAFCTFGLFSSWRRWRSLVAKSFSCIVEVETPRPFRMLDLHRRDEWTEGALTAHIRSVEAYNLDSSMSCAEYGFPRYALANIMHQNTGLLNRFSYRSLSQYSENNRGSISGRSKDFFSIHHHVLTDSVAHQASYERGTEGSFLCGEATGALSWPLTSIWCRV